MKTYALMLNHAPDRYTGLSEEAYMDIIKGLCCLGRKTYR